MEQETIRQLLAKFYDGTTTMEEEQALRHYFACADELPEDMKADKELFDSLVSLPQGFEKRMSDLIDNLEKRESEGTTKSGKSIFVKFYRSTIIRYAAAAVVAIGVISAVLLVNNQKNNSFASNTEMTEEEAFAMYQQSLALFSDTMSKGMEGVNKADETIEKTSNTLKQIMK